jgi:hypothetical protein
MDVDGTWGRSGIISRVKFVYVVRGNIWKDKFDLGQAQESLEWVAGKVQVRILAFMDELGKNVGLELDSLVYLR